MSSIKRFGVSIEHNLLREFDGFIKKKGYENRSEAIRDLIREALVKEKTTHPEAEATGTINIVYNHHRPRLSDRLTHLQHNSPLNIFSSTHVHLDKDLCLEVIVVNGKAGDIISFGEKLGSLRGVLHSQIFLFSPAFE